MSEHEKVFRMKSDTPSFAALCDLLATGDVVNLDFHVAPHAHNVEHQVTSVHLRDGTVHILNDSFPCPPLC